MAKKRIPTKKAQGGSISLIPLHDRVIVEVLESRETLSGIILPDSMRDEKPEQGIVVAVGEGRWSEDGARRIPVSVVAGDQILFSKYSPEEVTIEGKKYLVVREDAIFAVIK